jgi:nucleoside-diphosphate-sugar epimerase
VKVLVTGAAGFIGSHLTQRLLSLGHEVIGIDNFSDYYGREYKEFNAKAVRESGCLLVEADLAKDDIRDWVKGVDVVYHPAAQPGISSAVSFATYLRNNLNATYRLLDALEGSSSLQLFVNVSTSSVYGLRATEAESVAPEPASYYGVTKLAAEQLVLSHQRDRGMPGCSLRLFSVYGERERPDKLYPRLIRSILQDIPFPLFDGSREHSRSFTYVGDIVDAFVSVIDHKDACIGEVINIGSDKEMTTGEAIDIVESLLGKLANYELKPRRGGDQLRTHANISKARKLLDFEPKTNFRTGIKNEIDWMRELIEAGL